MADRTHDYSRFRVLTPRLISDTPRADASAVDLLAQCSVPDLVDAVGPFQAMDLGIRVLDPSMPRLVGSALTVRAIRGDNLTIHGALIVAGPGDVLVIDWGGFHGACGTGEQSLRLPMERGLRGVVIDGCWRDVAEIAAMGLPIYGRGISAVSPPKASVGDINVPAVCGGVIVNPGDVLVADAEGVVVVPHQHARRVAESVHQRMAESRDTTIDLVAEERHRAERFARAFEAAGGVKDPSGGNP